MPSTDIQQGSLALLFGAPSMTLSLNGGDAAPGGGGQTLTFAGMVLTEVAATRTAKTIETQNAGGVTVNITTYDAGDEVTLTIKPAGPNRAGAKGINDYFPRPGGYAALIDATDISHLDNAAWTIHKGGISAASTGLAYGIKSASKASSSTGNVVWTVTLMRMEGITSWVPLT
jgi:hypothetical protein